MKEKTTVLRRMTLVTATALAGAFGGVVLSGVQAHAAPSSTLVASPNNLTAANALDVVNAPSAQVSVSLDPNCFNVFKKGQTYTIGAVSGDTTVATVSPSGSGALHCGDSATFTVSAVCSAAGGSTNITFTPVAGPSGIQKKLAGTAVPVQVTNVTSAACNPGPPPPTPGANPAAPAVANLYLDNNPLVPNTSGNTVNDTCKTLLGKNWRGQVISAVAHWMPTPESVKDTYFADPNDWLLYVETEVNALCNVSSGGFLESDGSGSQSGATFGSPLMPYSGPLGP